MKDRANETRRALFTTEARKQSTMCNLQFLGSVLIVVGFFGPWVAHETAALTVTGYEMSEFAKFFPRVQGGVVPVRRALFITPLLAADVSLALALATNLRPSRGPILRFGITALAVPLTLVALPPFQAILEPQYRLQLILVAATALLALTTPLARQLSEHVRGTLLLLLALVGAAPAFWQAILLRPLVGAVYQTVIWPGWGFIVSIIGFLMLLLAGARSVLRS